MTINTEPPTADKRVRRTVRLRLTILYGALFLASGACLLALTYALIVHRSPSAFISTQAHAGAQVAQHQAAGSRLGTPTRTTIPHTQTVRWTGLGQMLIVSAIALTAMAIVSVLVGWLLAGRMLEPLRTMTASARRISAQNLHERLAVTGPRDELKDLGDTIDDLLDRLATVVDAQRQFAANASHELRTPITLQRTLLESALTHPHPTAKTWRSTSEQVLTSTEKQAKLIDALLLLARSDHSLQHPEPAEVAAITEAVLRTFAQEAQAAQLAIETDLTPAWIMGDARLLEHLASNLLQNAIRYNIPHGTVAVTVTVGSQYETAVLRVANTGPAVPPEQMRRLLQPFQRLDTGRGGERDGHGLGLAIIAAIARTHDAILRPQSIPSGGLDVEISFPTVAPTPRESTRENTTADTSGTTPDPSHSVPLIRRHGSGPDQEAGATPSH